MAEARTKYRLSERQARRIVGQPRGTQRYSVIVRADEDALTRAILQLATQYGRYGYRRITALLREAGWYVGVDRVQRIWRREGLKVPKKQRPRGRLWLSDGPCIRLRPERRNHVWSYDFVEAQTFRDDSTGSKRAVQLVYAQDANAAAHRISVMTPAGAALLGLSEGQTMPWRTRDGREKSLTV